MAKRSNKKTSKPVIRKDSVEMHRSDGHPPVVVQRTTLEAIKSSADTVDLSADGKTLVSSENHFVRIWDVATGSERLKIKVGAPSPRARLSPDGRTIAAVSNESATIKFYDATSGEEHGKLMTVNDLSLYHIEFSPDGKLVAMCGAIPHGRRGVTGGAEIWHTDSFEIHRLLPSHPEVVTQVAFHPTRPIMATAAGGHHLQLWDLDSATVAETINLPAPADLSSVRFTADGARVLVAGQSTPAILYSLDPVEVVATLTSGKNDASDIAIRSDGRLAFIAGSHIEIVDLETRSLVGTLPSPEWGTTSLALSADGNLLAANCNGRRQIHLWDVSPLNH